MKQFVVKNEFYFDNNLVRPGETIDVDQDRIEKLKNMDVLGQEVISDPAKTGGSDGVGSEPTYQEIKAKAKELAIEGYNKMKMAELIEAIATKEKELADAAVKAEEFAKAKADLEAMEIADLSLKAEEFEVEVPEEDAENKDKVVEAIMAKLFKVDGEG